LGGRGGDICDGTDPVGMGSTRHDDDKGHLINRGQLPTAAYGLESPVPDMTASNFLAYGAGGITDSTQFLNDLQTLIGGVHEYGCGIEAQMESWYRFLVQPDPYVNIVRDQNNKGALDGVDGDLIKQRHDFLRPDSLVAIVVLTDEDDSTPDPRAVGGQGWAFNTKRFPGSVGGGAARGTSACDTVSNALSAACTSCGFQGHEDDPGCRLPGDFDSQTGESQVGYYPAKEDTLNTRWVRMKQRYGVDPQFPISRYVLGLSSALVPNRDGEVYNGRTSDDQPGSTYNACANCVNPLFAQDLPTDANAELCHLTPGPRSSDLVVFATITGVPSQLLAPTMDDSVWTGIIGRDPTRYDYTGMDPLMVQSPTPRAGLPSNLRVEWDTGLVDLEYACTFDLPAPKNCADAKYLGACDCTATGTNPPLCAPNPDDGNKLTLQVAGKAYPGIRQLTVAHALGERGVVASICPSTLDTTSPDYGFRPALRALGDRMAKSLVLAE
jgi:hypothetical protein